MRQMTIRRNFTPKYIESIQTPETGRTIVYDSKTSGLGIMAQPTGTKSFFWFRRTHDDRKWINLGKFPNLSVVGARRAAMKHNSVLADWQAGGFEGLSPFDADAGMTLGRLHDRYRVARFADKPRRAKYSEWMFKKYFSRWKNRTLGQIRGDDVRRLHAKMKIDAPIMGNRVVEFIRAMYGYATKQGWWEGLNPGSAVEMAKEVKRQRYLDDETHSGEVRRLFRALRKEKSRDLRDYVLLALFTGARRSDVLGMKWANVKLTERTWLIATPKNSVPYIVALSPEATAVLKKRKRDLGKSEYVFPSFGRTKHVVDLRKPWARLLKRAKITDFRQHDLRRSFASRMAKLDVSLLKIGRALGHQSLAATQIYARLQSADLRESVEATTASIVQSSKTKQ